jgi:hypothetical protein
MGQTGDSYLEDLAHERVVWKMQRWGWAVLTLILLAALIGFLGHGPLSKAKAGQPKSVLWAEYDRFGRHHASAVLKVHLGASGATSLPAIWIAREYLDQVEMEQIYPAPERVKVAEGRLIYIFDLARTNEQTEITFHLKPSGFGKKSVKLGLVDGPELQFSQFIYP